MPKECKKRDNYFLVAIESCTKEVGKNAFQIIEKSALPDSESGRELWAWRLSHLIEAEAKTAIVKMFITSGFMESLRQDLVRSHGKNLKNYRKKGITEIWREYFKKDNLDISLNPKEAVKILEQEGVIYLHGEDLQCLFVDSELPMDKWDRCTWGSVKAAYSKAKKERNEQISK